MASPGRSGCILTLETFRSHYNSAQWSGPPPTLAGEAVQVVPLRLPVYCVRDASEGTHYRCMRNIHDRLLTGLFKHADAKPQNARMKARREYRTSHMTH
jgi:hypothetical protein